MLTVSKTCPLRIAASALLAIAAAVCSADEPYPNTSFFGVPFSEDEAWYQQCMRVQHLAPPTSDVPVGQPKQCDASGIYYDTRARAGANGADWKRVRECAVSSSDHKVLMMLYANGYGVAKDEPLAIKYACGLENVAKAEMEARIAHLANGIGTRPFDFCDDITSGFSGTICASIKERQHDNARLARLDRYAAKLQPGSKPAFRALRQAAEAYSQKLEADMRGTAAPSMAMSAAGRVMDQFAGDVIKAASGKVPPCRPTACDGREAELGRTLQAVLARTSTDEHHPERIGDSTISRDDIAEAQRAWIAYRDAWMAFLATGASTADPASVKAMLTARRIARLTKLID